MSLERSAREYIFNWGDAATLSDEQSLDGGCFGTLIVPSGSTLIGKTVQVVAVSPNGNFSDTDLLATPKTLAAGANAFTAEEIAEIGAVQRCHLKLSAATTGAASAVLLWKS